MFYINFSEKALTKALFLPPPQKQQQQQQRRQEEPRQDEPRQEEHEKRALPKLSVGIYVMTYILWLNMEIIVIIPY